MCSQLTLELLVMCSTSISNNCRAMVSLVGTFSPIKIEASMLVFLHPQFTGSNLPRIRLYDKPRSFHLGFPKTWKFPLNKSVHAQMINAVPPEWCLDGVHLHWPQIWMGTLWTHRACTLDIWKECCRISTWSKLFAPLGPGRCRARWLCVMEENDGDWDRLEA